MPLFLLSCCGPKGEKVERIIEGGVEVVINHREPYKLKGEHPNEYKYDVFNASGVFIARTSLDNYGQYGISDSPLYAMAKKGRLYCIHQKESGFKELVVYNMSWE